MGMLDPLAADPGLHLWVQFWSQPTPAKYPFLLLVEKGGRKGMGEEGWFEANQASHLWNSRVEIHALNG